MIWRLVRLSPVSTIGQTGEVKPQLVQKFIVQSCITKKPKLSIDFNEMIEDHLVLLSNSIRPN